MNFSYWEIKSWMTDIDFTIVGSGIVGLSCALRLRESYPKANILVLEKGILPQGASTKNAGFACFGSLSELINDLKTHSEEEVFELVKKRKNGLQLLRETLGDNVLDYQEHGGCELFTPEHEALFENCMENEDRVNGLLFPLFDQNVFSIKDNVFNFKNINPKYSFNRFEGQLDTGKMMQELLSLAQSKKIRILNNVLVESYVEDPQAVKIKTNHFEFSTRNLLIATNGFASQFLEEEVRPARAQVLITKPMKNLHIQGTFHLDEGYYYFRNINNRILFGGGRNLDIKGEETTEFAQTALIQDTLETLLRTTILPDTSFEIDHRWSGIMGVGSQKKAIVKQISDSVYCGVRLGGMGVAIGSLVGNELADLL